MTNQPRIHGLPQVTLPNGSTSSNIDDIANPKRQHEIVDSSRSTDGIDYKKVKEEADALVKLRIELQNKKRIADYRRIGKKRYPEFVKKFPAFFDSIRTVESDRLTEFTQVMHMMLNKMCQVKDNMISHTEMRNQVFEENLAQNQVFEENLAQKYYKRKEG
jgi:hypothetical protein